MMKGCGYTVPQKYFRKEILNHNGAAPPFTFIQKEEKIPYFTISSYLYDASLYIMHGVAIDGFFFPSKN